MRLFKRVAKTAKQADPISRIALHYLLAALVLVNSVMLLFMPWWVPAIGIACALWRLLIAQGGMNYPARWLKSVLAIAVFIGLFGQFGIRPVLDFFLCLLLLSVSLRLLELQDKQDASRQVWIIFFVLMTVFIFEQTPLYGLLVYLIAFLLLTAVVANFTDPKHLRAAPLYPMRQAGLLCLLAAPIALVLFVGLPRMGPLWHMPLQQQASAKTGMSDTMSPGDIVKLSESDELVMRVTFPNQVPPRNELYWLAMYLDRFDGVTWRETCQHCYRLEQGRVTDVSQPYEIILEPHQQHWLYLLTPSQLAQGRYWRAGDIYRSERPLNQRLQFTAYLQANRSEHTKDLARYLQLPAQSNPQTQAWVAELRAQGLNDHALLAHILQTFNAEFSYTLEPPALNGERIDQFLFAARAGYCEHFSSALVFALRAAGIPARVAVGYMGGEINQTEGFVVVRQHDAHAWAEVWLDGQWQRVDPTSYVAPERISSSFSSYSLSKAPAALQTMGSWLNQLQRQRDLLEYWWGRWVLGYSNADQASALDRLRNVNWHSFAASLALVAGTALGGWLLWQIRRERLSHHTLLLLIYRDTVRQYQRRGLLLAENLTPAQNAQSLFQAGHRDAEAFKQAAAELTSLLYTNDSAVARKSLSLVCSWLQLNLRARLRPAKFMVGQ